MTISKDLFLAILSMDAYNRSYGAGVDLGVNSDVKDTLLENIKILQATSSLPTSDAYKAGFYAIAYQTTADIGDPDNGGVIPAAGFAIYPSRPHTTCQSTRFAITGSRCHWAGRAAMPGIFPT